MESDFTTKEIISKEILLKAYTQMMLAKSMADIYEENRNICKYVHSTSRGHEAIQLATAYQLSKEDWVSPYYRDESLLLGIGFTPYQLMLQDVCASILVWREFLHLPLGFFLHFLELCFLFLR
jgi:2-oxoisovalerate dehydrogenase E1 component